MVDIEADGPIPGDYSMVSFGAVVVEPTLSRSFYGRLRPISDRWIPEALAVSGHSRDETLGFDGPAAVMAGFASSPSLLSLTVMNLHVMPDCRICCHLRAAESDSRALCMTWKGCLAEPSSCPPASASVQTSTRSRKALP